MSDHSDADHSDADHTWDQLCFWAVEAIEAEDHARWLALLAAHPEHAKALREWARAWVYDRG